MFPSGPAGRVDDASFRDPAGYVFEQRGVILRAITAYGIADYRQLMESGLYKSLRDRRLFVPHEERPRTDAWPHDAELVIQPERVPVVSYPYEWSFGQLRDAALVTLCVQEHAMTHGMSLKDASAFNVQYFGSTPVFIDTLSLGADDSGPWPAYSQFCRHFLAPLFLMRDWWLNAGSMMRVALDGVPLDVASRALPLRSYLNFGCLVHIHAHAKSLRRRSRPGVVADIGTAAVPVRTVKPSRNPKPALISSLRATVEGLKLQSGRTTWSNYYDEAHHYSSSAESSKREVVAAAIARVEPALMYDLGGNTGVYTRLGTERGVYAVCFDLDPACVHQNYLQAKRDSDDRMLPLVMDLSNPSPGLGFASAERKSLEDRPRADLLLALALVHHLRISANVPLLLIARYLSRLGRALVIEWVPRDDPKVALLLAGRPNTFYDYDEPGFVDAFSTCFELEQVTRLADTGRAIYLYRSREK